MVTAARTSHERGARRHLLARGAIILTAVLGAAILAGSGLAGSHALKGLSWDSVYSQKDKGISWDGARGSKGISWDSAVKAKGISWDRLTTKKGLSWDPLVSTKGVSWDPVAQGVKLASTASYSPSSDMGSMQNITKFTGAQAYWNAGYTGRGVTVALIDTGVVPVSGLDARGKVINGPDLSFDSQVDNLRYLDGLGHGTHMAGIIAGNGSGFQGMAPGAQILNMKVGNYNGLVDVSQVIAAIDWVVQHKSDRGMNVKVINLSYGTNSQQVYTSDPLSYAVEQAWKAGIVVVCAAGNAGWARGGSLMDPATDPFDIAVGAIDMNGTMDRNDDTVATFSSNSKSGESRRWINLMAPGTHVVSLRDPGSFIDENYGSTGYVSDTLFRGSGTSQAAAIVSGAVALIAQQHPRWNPDQIKRALDSTATPIPDLRPKVQGDGVIDLSKTLQQRGVSGLPQPWEPSHGDGTIEGSRGDAHLVLDGVKLKGEYDIFGAPVDASDLAALEAQGNSWSGGDWNGNSWSGNSWSGNSWSGNSWSGNSWSGNSWSGNSWSGNSWSGNSWSGNSWSGNSWSGNSWSGNSWSGNSWSGNSWD